MTFTPPNAQVVFTPLDVLTAEELNQLQTNLNGNIESLADAIPTFPLGADDIADSAITDAKINWNTLSQQNGSSASYISFGSFSIAWGRSTVTLNGTSAGSYGVRTVTLPVAFSNTTRCGVAITPEDPGSTNSLKVAAKFDSGSQLVITIGTGATADSASIITRFIVVGRTS